MEEVRRKEQASAERALNMDKDPEIKEDEEKDEIITPYKGVTKSPVQRQNSDKVQARKNNNFVQSSDPNTDREK